MLGPIRKMRTSLQDGLVHYQLPLGNELMGLNALVGSHLKLEFTGKIFCIDTHKEIKRSFGQGYCWESYQTLAECDSCIFMPKLCHYSKGTCRDAKWGEDHCLKPHIIYLANTGDIKVGITRKTQIPTRWIDQGASSALALFEVSERKLSGEIEIELAKKISDRTNWRKMLSVDIPEKDLVTKKQEIISEYSLLLEKHSAKIVDADVCHLSYPIMRIPEKFKALNLDKNAIIDSTLLGIKGQYLIFEQGVINMRKFQGYEVELTF